MPTCPSALTLRGREGGGQSQKRFSNFLSPAGAVGPGTGDIATAPVLPADGPQLGSWQVAVMRVDETPAGDASGRECPRAEQNRQRPIDLSEVAGNVRPVLPAGPPPPGWFSELCWPM